MRRGFLGVVVSLLMGMLITVTQSGSAIGEPPLGVMVRHPIHVRGNATTGPGGYSPAQIRHAYGIDQVSYTGAGQVIAVIDAYQYPTAASDLQTFISTFSLPVMYGLPNTGACTVTAGPHPCFQVIAEGSSSGTGSGGTSTGGGGGGTSCHGGKKNNCKVSAQTVNATWALEQALDTQWAHAIAPGADILLVQGNSSLTTDLLNSVSTAIPYGVTVVSMSWGMPESSGETTLDGNFNHAGVTFVASSGDSGYGIQWPAVSPYVVGVGGTSLPLDGSGNLTGPETAWSGSGGGISAYESEPQYQTAWPIPTTGGYRGVPDVSFDADPYTGVPIYDSTGYNGQYGWFQVGGTSFSAPAWGAIFAVLNSARRAAGKLNLSSASSTYSPAFAAAAASWYPTDYRGITSGSNGSCSICSATSGYNFVTGLGTSLVNGLTQYFLTY